MTQRLVAAMLAAPAIAALLLYSAFTTLPYATYQPGGTVDILGTDPENNDAEIIQVDGHETFRDDGELRMTTVRVSPAAEKGQEGGENLLSLLSTWFDGDNAVYPYDLVHGPDETPESSREQGQVQMSTSQDTAIAIALAEMGEPVAQVLKVAELTEGMPAADVLEVGDVIRTVDGTEVADADELVAAVGRREPGDEVRLGITRDGTDRTVRIKTVDVDGEPKVGITPGVGYDDFPFEVRINVPASIGGPSAGLVFSLAVYDTLTPGSLTGGHHVAGTGEIDTDGSVGPIGGIQQKIAGARDDGADLFLVPVDNCADALEADPGDMRLMMAETMHDVRLALEDYAADDDADLPSCDDADAAIAERAAQ
ncbi:PDZ domain-containing protein [Nocardioides sp. C4-1]|uniref:YlbL family protein n=1 Tax=Nocardioides sp. C4-1 TaxID=3151851 RepID=UPI0032668EC3